MKRFSLLATSAVMSIILFATVGYAYNAACNCQRTITFRPILGNYLVNTAWANADNNGLENGTINVHAHAGGTPKTKAASFSASSISWSVYDEGPWSSSGAANAFVGGYDPTGVYRSDSDSDSN